jgi:hypothetical protein
MMMGGWLLMSLSMATVVGLAIWAVVTPADRRGDQHTSDRDRARLLVAGCAAGESGQVHWRRLTVLGDDEHRELGARR